MDDTSVLDSSLDLISTQDPQDTATLAHLDNVKKALKLKTKPLIYKRAADKRAIGRILDRLHKETHEDAFISVQIETIKDKKLQIEDINQKVLEVYLNSEVAENLDKLLEKEQDGATDNSFGVDLKVLEIKKKLGPEPSNSNNDTSDP